MDGQDSHIEKRNSAYGRWLPVVLYLFTLGFTAMEIAQLAAWHLLWLIVFPLLPLALYVRRVQRSVAWRRISR